MKRVRVASAALGLTSSRRYLLAHGSAAEAYLVHDRPHHCPMSEGGHLCVGRQHCESEHRQDPDRQHEDGIVVIEPIPMPSMGSCSRQVWPSATNATAGATVLLDDRG